MKQRLLVILQITIAIALIVVMSTSGSAEAVTMKYQSSGRFAFVDFFNDSNCQMISGFVNVSEEMFKYAPGSPVRPGPMGFLTISIDNWCDNDDDDDYGYGKWGTATLELTRFRVSGNLRSASAEGKGTLIWNQPYYYPYPPPPYPPPVIPPLPPYPPPPPPEEVVIKIIWTAESDMSSGHNNLRSTYGNIRTHMHSSGTFRYATATGLIKGETFEVEVKPPPPPDPYPTPIPEPPYPYPYPPPYPYPAPYPYSYATIGRSITGFISIFKP
jgi:hypothetical protein